MACTSTASATPPGTCPAHSPLPPGPINPFPALPLPLQCSLQSLLAPAYIEACPGASGTAEAFPLAPHTPMLLQSTLGCIHDHVRHWHREITGLRLVCAAPVNKTLLISTTNLILIL